jgi:hypothetical protein
MINYPKSFNNTTIQYTTVVVFFWQNILVVIEPNTLIKL